MVGNTLSGLLILLGLFVQDYRSGIWAIIASVMSIVLSKFLDIEVYGFSGVLTAIALGFVFRFNYWMVLLSIVVSVTLQALIPLPLLTAPFILTVWVFLYFRQSVKIFHAISPR